MNFIQKFKTKKLFYYIYLGVLIINIIALYFLFSFNNKYLYSTIYLNEEIITTQATRGIGNINLNQFENTINAINNKKTH